MNNDREKVVIKTSVIIIIANIILAGFKSFVGYLANSIAIISDAVNNLSDALSSIIRLLVLSLLVGLLIRSIHMVMVELNI